MSLPEWTSPAIDLVRKLTAIPIRIAKRYPTEAAYLGVSFLAEVARLLNVGLAKPLSELRDCKLKKMQAIDLAEVADAHNRALLTRKQAEETEANAELKRSEARVNDAKARAIDSELEFKRLELEREAAQERRLAAEAKLEQAVAKLQSQGGELYLNPPSKSDEQGEPGAGPN